jgi:NADH dehydrogenase/NADH:ubiquinone oxidoreductase subunit G
MPNSISLLIDEKPVRADEGTTILKAARLVGIEIPTICFHDFCTSNALCRICVVEVEGSRTLVAACVAKVSEGMKVYTQTERVRQARRSILEMLASTVDLSEAPEIQALIREYGADGQRFPQAERRDPPLIDDNPMYIRDYAKCILCWRCVQVCAVDAQYTYAINFRNRGYKTSISTFYDIPMPETTCVFCGQCVGVCPTGALKSKRQWLLEQGLSEPQIMELTRFERKSRHKAGGPQ